MKPEICFSKVCISFGGVMKRTDTGKTYYNVTLKCECAQITDESFQEIGNSMADYCLEKEGQKPLLFTIETDCGNVLMLLRVLDTASRKISKDTPCVLVTKKTSEQQLVKTNNLFLELQPDLSSFEPE